MKKAIALTWLVLVVMACQQQMPPDTQESPYDIKLNLETAEYLASLPMKCIQNEFPYKSGLVIGDEDDLQLPKAHHPAFYGCFDWHSAVHGHWSLVYLLKEFPELSSQKQARQAISENLTTENIRKEIEYFDLNRWSKSFERTYGWAWLLKLAQELHEWDDPDAQRWSVHLSPLSEHIAKAYMDYLPKLAYPIRVGEHTNTAFGLSFAYDYAIALNNVELKEGIEQSARDFYMEDMDCPITWEPSGYDFLSPCLEEMNLMRKVLPESEFSNWSSRFLPQLIDMKLNLEPGKVKDRSDGKLVHLDGLNFSRAWCLYPLAPDNPQAASLADQHLDFSLRQIKDGDYSGEHWLASFALYALKMKTRYAE